MRKVTPVLLSSLAIMLGACSSSDSNTDDSPTGPIPEVGAGKEVVIDASQSTVYFNLRSGTEVAKAEDWDLSFNRTTVLVSDQARSGIAHTQSHFYDGGNPASSQQPVANNGQQFVNATNNTQLPSLLGAKKIIGDWINAGIKPAIYDWYETDSDDNLVPTEAYFIVRSASKDAYAKATISEIDNDNQTLTVKLNLQQVGENTFQQSSLYWDPSFSADGESCYDFDDAQQMADCNNNDWDLKFTVADSQKSLTFYTNGGESGNGDGAAYKMLSPNEYDRGSFDGINGIPPQAYSQDIPAGAFSSYSWYAYDPVNAGDHKLWPNYRVYVVDPQIPVSNINDGWYTPDTHPLTSSGQAFILRSAESNSYAKMTFKEADAAYNLTFSFAVQTSGDSAFNTTAIEWNTDLSDTQCFDFDTNSKINCSGSAWDIMLTSEGRSITLTTNGGLDSTGGDAAIYTVASDETLTGVDTAEPPQWQMLDPYKLQITDYYNDSGVAGHINFRYMPLSQQTP